MSAEIFGTHDERMLPENKRLNQFGFTALRKRCRENLTVQHEIVEGDKRKIEKKHKNILY